MRRSARRNAPRASTGAQCNEHPSTPPGRPRVRGARAMP